MGKFSWKSNLERKLRIFEKVIIIHEMKRLQIPPKHMSEKFCVHEKILPREIAAVNLSKIYLLKNARKTCKLNNRDLNRDWIITVAN